MSNASQSTFKYVTDLAKKDNLTMRQIAQVVAGARAKMVMVRARRSSSPTTWSSGSSRKPPTASTSCRRILPGALDDFVELVIPELQRRGLFRTEYTGRTLREHLGLPRPPSRYASAAPNEAAE